MNGLRYIRQRLGVSGSSLARRLAVSQPTVFEWEHGKRKIPSAKLKELSNILGVPEEYFGEISDEQEIEIEAFIQIQQEKQQRDSEDQEFEQAKKFLKDSIKRITTSVNVKPNKFDSFSECISHINSSAKLCVQFAETFDQYGNDPLLEKLLAVLVECHKETGADRLELIRALKKRIPEILEKAEEHAEAAKYFADNREEFGELY